MCNLSAQTAKESSLGIAGLRPRPKRGINPDQFGLEPRMPTAKFPIDSCKASVPISRRIRLLLMLPVLSSLLVSCARFEPKPLSPAATAEQLENRSLTNSALEAFIPPNLPHMHPAVGQESSRADDKHSVGREPSQAANDSSLTNW